jgi:hypothetical protein
MMGVLGLLLVLAGVGAMSIAPRVGAARRADDDRISPAGLFIFLTGCLVVGAGAILITEWWLES